MPSLEDTHLSIEHLALCTQDIALRHQVLDLLPALKHALNGLVDDNFSLIQLLLDPHDAVRLLRVLVFREVVLQLGHGKRVPLLLLRVLVRDVGVGGARVFCDEFVAHLGEQLLGDALRVFLIGDYYAADVFIRVMLCVEEKLCTRRFQSALDALGTAGGETNHSPSSSPSSDFLSCFVLNAIWAAPKVICAGC